MLDYTELALDIRSAILNCENFHQLGDEQHAALLSKATSCLLKQAVSQAGLDTRERIVVIGPETMGAKMIAALTRLDQTGELGMMAICTRTIVKDRNNARSWHWNCDTRSLLTQNPQIVLIDDTFRYGTTLKKVQAMVAQYGATIDVVAVLRNYCSGVECSVPIVSLESCYQ